MPAITSACVSKSDTCPSAPANPFLTAVCVVSLDKIKLSSCGFLDDTPSETLATAGKGPSHHMGKHSTRPFPAAVPRGPLQAAVPSGPRARTATVTRMRRSLLFLLAAGSLFPQSSPPANFDLVVYG